MRNLFAVDDPARADRSYINTRAVPHEGAARARANCDELWRDFEPYAGEHFLAEFPYQFHQRWFEMYLAVTLLRAGLEIRCPNEGTPDVWVRLRDGRAMWIEATAPTGGDESNPDHVAHSPAAKDGPPVAYRVPTERIIMRVCGALRTKATQLEGYRDSGVIAAGELALAAINVSLIPHGFFDAERYGLAATYGVGPQYVVLDAHTGKKVDAGFQHAPELLRSSGSTVDAAPFLHQGFAHVAGALISQTDAANCPSPFGLDLMLLPNPHAAPPYPVGQLPVGREWRLEPGADAGVFRIAEVIEHTRPEQHKSFS